MIGDIGPVGCGPNQRCCNVRDAMCGITNGARSRNADRDSTSDAIPLQAKEALFFAPEVSVYQCQVSRGSFLVANWRHHP